MPSTIVSAGTTAGSDRPPHCLLLALTVLSVLALTPCGALASQPEYFVVPGKTTHKEALEKCTKEGGKLAPVNSLEEEKKMFTAVEQSYANRPDANVKYAVVLTAGLRGGAGCNENNKDLCYWCFAESPEVCNADNAFYHGYSSVEGKEVHGAYNHWHNFFPQPGDNLKYMTLSYQLHSWLNAEESGFTDVMCVRNLATPARIILAPEMAASSAKEPSANASTKRPDSAKSGSDSAGISVLSPAWVLALALAMVL